MATGGYSANKMMLTMMAGVPADNMPVRGSNTVTGESILLTAPNFPRVVNVDQYHWKPRDIESMVILMLKCPAIQLPKQKTTGDS